MGLFPIRDIFEEWITNVGQRSLKNCEAEATKDPAVFVSTCWTIINRYLELIRLCCFGDAVFTSSLDKAFRTFINRNALTNRHSPTNPNIAADILAQYADLALKDSTKSSYEDSERESMLDKLMLVFNYLEPKDAFMTYYSKLLARRLIGGVSVGNDLENLLISKLKQKCGFDHTSQLSRMVEDVSISHQLTWQCLEQADKQAICPNLSFLIIARGIWPLKEHISRCDLNLTPLLESTRLSFESFYGTKHPGRKLSWLHGISRGEVRWSFTEKKYVLKCSTLQLVVLSLMGQAGQKIILKFSDVQHQTGIPEANLLSVLKTLLRTKVLLCQPPLTAENPELLPSHLFKLNPRFQSSQRVININIGLDRRHQSSSEQDDKNQETQQQIEEGRKAEIQACIVRILKMRKIYDHKSLFQDVYAQLSRRFDPGMVRVKRCIDILIDKGYIERVPNTTDKYQYVA